MSIKVHGYITNADDGSSHLTWIKDSDKVAFEKIAKTPQYRNDFHDGDGLTLRATLIFDTYLGATHSGIRFTGLGDFELEEEAEVEEEKPVVEPVVVPAAKPKGK